ncbi:MAG: ABC transporter ATP-binding protein [Rhodospirillaceae bacterium]|nr:ABC transporter ATP-binding protein [Rhodospirillaceae bacterium]|tara:strand:+ start:145 stop:1203 length:1059 start_codon:yes stop_codon:yes gene_type:complete
MARERNDLVLEHVSHRFDTAVAVDDASLTVGASEVVCLVGPSGSGKTTLLRIAAGLEPLQQGRVLIGGEVMGDARMSVSPEDRNVGLVFQDYALFPHLTVRGNIAFGLKQLSADQRDEQVSQALERTGMSGYASSYPHQLSGGQQQRVALARALAPRPRIVLLDEPFSGLDASLRHRVRDQAAAILRDSGIATLMVTHDPEEAMYLADRIAVMEQGLLRQIGTPDEIYLSPANAFVAAFFGDVNRFSGTVEGGQVATPLGAVPTNGHTQGTPVDVMIRPEALSVSTEAAEGGTCGIVVAARFLGRRSLVDVRLNDTVGTLVRVHVAGRFLPKQGVSVTVGYDDAQAHVFDTS